ncbi:unnamed protein product [Moneuplotes crassus]|uniref:Uncharacterized protein n=1 Tax=Euplotes crassus TaxID=5936 RepID=A0AAD1UDI8_EUPCR|nr:unnamed protein product [Moneuplotes crassus]
MATAEKYGLCSKTLEQQEKELKKKITSRFKCERYEIVDAPGAQEYHLIIDNSNPTCHAFMKQIIRSKFMQFPDTCVGCYDIVKQDRNIMATEIMKLHIGNKYDRFYLYNNTSRKISLQKISLPLFSICGKTYSEIAIDHFKIGSSQLLKRIVAYSKLLKKISFRGCIFKCKEFTIKEGIWTGLKAISLSSCTDGEGVELTQESETLHIIMKPILGCSPSLEKITVDRKKLTAADF